MTGSTGWPLRCAGNDAVSSAYVYNETHVRAIPELLSRNLREYLLHSARAREHRKVLRLEDEIIFAVVQLVGVEHLVPRVVCCRDPSIFGSSCLRTFYLSFARSPLQSWSYFACCVSLPRPLPLLSIGVAFQFFILARFTLFSFSLLLQFQVQCIVYQIMRGMLCLHTSRILHRDLKPGNILLRSYSPTAGTNATTSA